MLLFNENHLYTWLENHIYIYIKPSYVGPECLCPSSQEVIGQAEDNYLRSVELGAVSQYRAPFITQHHTTLQE